MMILATRNPHKLREFRRLIGDEQLEPLPDEVELGPEVGETFADNALDKARTAAAATGAVAIAAIGLKGLAERRDGAGPVLQPFADVAEREPRGRKVRRNLQRLSEKLGRRRKVARRFILARPVVAPVGDQIAGRGKERRAGGHRPVRRRVGHA